ILSVRGNNLFQSRLGIDVEDRVTALIRKLLIPLTLEKLLSHDHDLPHYAEAAPDEFLTIIEEDLRCSDPVVFGLLKPDSGSFWAPSSQTGLFWALECLAWNPKNLLRVSVILAQLSRQKIDNNRVNKPDDSLQNIFRSWIPQTAAPVSDRVKVLKKLTEDFPKIGWEICIKQIKPGHSVGHYSYRPRWRSDASGAGQVVTNGEIYKFTRKTLGFLIDWPSHDEKTLGDLVEYLQGMPIENQPKVWNLIDEWSRTAGEAAKAELRERIRLFAFTQRGRQRKLEDTTRDRAREAYDSLRPNDPVIRHSWLFANQYVPVSTEEIEKEGFNDNDQEADERIDKLRREAITEIWDERGFKGVKDLLAPSGATDLIGRYTASCVTDVCSQSDFIQRCLSLDGELQSKAEWCLRGFLSAIGDDVCAEVINMVAKKLSVEESKRLFVCAPFNASTWRLLDDSSEDIRTGYWKDVVPYWKDQTPAELNELIDCLLEAHRPRAAFHVVCMNFKDIETSRLKRLLHDIATVNTEPAGQVGLDPYYISKALDLLDGRVGVTPYEMAQFEFLFIVALDHSKHGIPNLESQIAQSPEIFVQAVALAFKRSDEGEDPPEWRIENPEQRAVVVSAAYHLLNQIKKIPGTDENGHIDKEALVSWIEQARQLLHKHARGTIGDQYIGQLLAKAPEGESGMWPCEAVCEAIEKTASSGIGQGFSKSVYNSRGLHWLGKGGEQERELALKYDNLADRLYHDYPYVAVVVKEIAKSYTYEAKCRDTEAGTEKRLRTPVGSW
ncbi:hypothetical protein, partial [Thiolapillus sp.]|uniref:hypothetical protein n=1 Tax=Thiolapillus sp. TaxID=2017437 RepID=UPI003AF89A0D